MKKIYALLFSALVGGQLAAQPTLTKVANEPIIGDINARMGFDSTGVLPVNTGSGQVWNFTAINSNSTTTSSTYTTVASTSSASSFPAATIASDDGGGAYTYYKSTSTQYALLGTVDPSGIYINVSPNPAVMSNWPIAFGYSNTDLYSGNVNASGLTGTVDGTITVTAPGSGTLMLPGGLNFSNVLQLKIVQTTTASLLGGLTTATIASTTYQYYTATQKFPVLELQYQETNNGGTITDSYNITVNNNVLASVKQLSSNTANVSLYPNPASDKVTVTAENTKGETVSVEVMNQLGQVVKTVDAGNATSMNKTIELSGLQSGVYFVKTIVGEKATTKKLIVR